MLIKCHACQRDFEVRVYGMFHCPHCQALNSCGSQVNASVDAYEWEDTWRHNFLAAFIATLKKLILEPVSFFKSLASRRGFNFWPAFVFMMTAQCVGILVSLIGSVGLSFVTPVIKTFMGQQGVNADLLVGFLGLPFTFLFLIILVPIASVVGLYLSAAINHIFVNIFIKDHQPFEETLKVVAYCMGVNILMVVPVFGGLAAGILQVVFLIIGLREIHHTNTSQAVLAVILPYLLCCGFFVTIISLIMSFIFSGFIAL